MTPRKSVVLPVCPNFSCCENGSDCIQTLSLHVGVETEGPGLFSDKRNSTFFSFLTPGEGGESGHLTFFRIPVFLWVLITAKKELSLIFLSFHFKGF